MSELRKKRRQCIGKLKYDAEYDARLGIAEHHGKKAEMNAYLCPHCEFWHIGHSLREDA